MRSRLQAIGRQLTRHRSTRVTSEGVQFLLFTLAVGIAAVNTGNNLFYLLLAMMLSIVLMSGLVAEYSLRRLEFSRHLPDLLYINEPAMTTLVVKNRKSRLPTFSIRLFDVIEGKDVDRGLTIRQLLPGTSHLLSYPLMATTRGRLKLDGIRVVTSFPFGLFLKKAYYPISAESVVCPAIRPLDETMVETLMATGHEHHAARRGHGNDLYNLRLYHSGDDSRNIHWVTTAKTSQLIVRETEAEQQRRATVCLMTLAPPSHDASFEEAVALAAALISHLSAQGYHLSLVAGAYRSVFGQGERHVIELLMALGLCQRQTPGPAGTDVASPLDHDPEDGALIVIRAWEGAVLDNAGPADTILDTTAFRESFYVV